MTSVPQIAATTFAFSSVCFFFYGMNQQNKEVNKCHLFIMYFLVTQGNTYRLFIKFPFGRRENIVFLSCILVDRREHIKSLYHVFLLTIGNKCRRLFITRKCFPGIQEGDNYCLHVWQWRQQIWRCGAQLPAQEPLCIIIITILCHSIFFFMNWF